MKLQLEGSRLRGCWWQIKTILYSCDVWVSWFLLLFGVGLHENTCYFWQFFWKTCIQLDLHLSNIPWILSSLFRFYEKWDSRITRVLWMTQISKNQTLHLFLGVVKKKSYIDFKKKSCFLAVLRAKLIKFSGFQMLQNYRVKNLNHKGQVV